MITFAMNELTAITVRRALSSEVASLRECIIKAVELGNFMTAQGLTEKLRETENVLDTLRAEMKSQEATA